MQVEFLILTIMLKQIRLKWLTCKMVWYHYLSQQMIVHIYSP